MTMLRYNLLSILHPFPPNLSIVISPSLAFVTAPEKGNAVTGFNLNQYREEIRFYLLYLYFCCHLTGLSPPIGHPPVFSFQ
jgi:hypothetical protein